ncbi:PR-1-like protein [Ascodesmis nigricans]|uniref:PR-1-like protein n=1 Tax=Ascodesmis nigricans TaxID=341454 RepID=A0A4S2N690_9PEZI|nr:PR-1-like protein [Ascodesmis nigricans]
MARESAYNNLKKPVLEAHNSLRKNFTAEPLTWDDDLADSAQEYAEECEFEHSGISDIGENLAAGYTTPEDAVTAWSNEEDDYKTGKITKDAGHFTQMVWKNTTMVGCGWKECDGILKKGLKQVLLVCHYSPQGNWKDKETVKANVGENVHKSMGTGKIGMVRKVWRSVWGVGAMVVVWCWLQ